MWTKPRASDSDSCLGLVTWGKYIGEHRRIAEAVIGRSLHRSEYVIRVNRRAVTDNRPENLFICATATEFCRRRNGALPWPSASNLHMFKRVESDGG
jgi:hypothetical protein